MTRAAQLAGLGSLEGSAPAYACRAWVNFNGEGTLAIRASGNCSSITDNGVGDYTFNFATAMPDANYTSNASWGMTWGNGWPAGPWMNVNRAGSTAIAPTTSAFRFNTFNTSATAVDALYCNVVVFR